MVAHGFARDEVATRAARIAQARSARLELVELKPADTCCGFGGTFAVKFPDDLDGDGRGEVRLSPRRAQIISSRSTPVAHRIQGMFDKQGKQDEEPSLAVLAHNRGSTTASAFKERHAVLHCHDLIIASASRRR